MKRRGMRIAQAAGFGTAVALASSGAAAQGASGTVIGAPEPGRFAASFDIGIVLLQMPRFRYGDVYGGTGVGAPSVGAVFDEREREGSIAPSLGLSWGLPGGLFGQRAEVFGQFAFARATDSGTFDGSNPLTVVTVPFVNGAASSFFPGVTTTGFSFFSSKTGNPTYSRDFTTYDGQIGTRVHIRKGAWSFSPGVYLGFQRADLNESVNLAGTGNSFLFDLSSGVTSDYYQVGISLGTTYNVSQQVALFGVLQGGLDYIRSQLDASSNMFFSGKGNVFPASVSDRDNRVSGRVGLRAGIAFSPNSAFTITFSGLAQYIGSVSHVVYPTHSPLQASFPTNGTVPARLGSEDQLNFGFAMGGTLRF